MSKNIVLIRHIDLDGIGTEIIFKAAFGTYVQIYSCDYKDLKDTLNTAFSDDIDRDFIICDLSIKNTEDGREIAEMIDKINDDSIMHNDRAKIMFIDHHTDSLWLAEKYSNWAFVDESACGTLLLHKNLMYHYYSDSSNLIQYAQFAVMVDDYDRWVHKIPESKDFNTLYYLIGAEHFVERFLSNPSTELKPSEKFLLSIENAKKERYFQDKAATAKIIQYDYDHPDVTVRLNIAVVFADQYVSELGHYLLETLENEDVVVAAIIDLANRKVSLRGVAGIYCNAIAHRYGGGGHSLAAGFPLNDTQLEVIIGTLF